MGMFDTIYCHFPLPIPAGTDTMTFGPIGAGETDLMNRLKGVAFQTKSLKCLGHEYHLMLDGRLWKKTREDGDADPIESDTPYRWVLAASSFGLNEHPRQIEFYTYDNGVPVVFRAWFDSSVYLIALARVVD